MSKVLPIAVDTRAMLDRCAEWHERTSQDESQAYYDHIREPRISGAEALHLSRVLESARRHKKFAESIRSILKIV